ncbi:MAG: phosphogluconate dehydrogenase C-terminal domain-containing protein [Bacteroidota bacterium]
MKKVTLLGAGGKMGMRIAANLKDTAYQMTYVEVSDEAKERVESKYGITCTSAEEAVPEADYVIMAVPDIYIKKVADSTVPLMKSGATAFCLDPAAPLAGALPERADVNYFASHPAHPSVFNWEPGEEAHFDFFGGIAAKQVIVCAIIQGEESSYKESEELAKIMYAPVTVSHKITIEQMGILEPALSETFGAAVVSVMKEAVDTVVEKGVPKDAAYDFFLGHINIELALLFDKLPGGKFSDAALKAIELGKPIIFKENWKDIFEWDHVMKQIKAIT